MSEHSVLAPSSAKQWSICAASPSMQARFAEVESDSQREGNAAHWLALQLWNTPVMLVPQFAPNGAEIDGEMRDAVAEYLSLIPADAVLEKRVNIPSINAACFGTVDARWHEGNRCHILDLKYGHVYVDEFENLQGLCYAIGALDSVTGLGDQTIQVRIEIFQPRAYGYEAHRVWDLPASDLRGWANRLNHAAHLSVMADPSATPGPHCGDCRAAGGCSALKAAAARIVDSAGTATVLDLSSTALGKELRALDRVRATLGARFEALETEAAIRAKTERIPHWKLQASAGREEWLLDAASVIAVGAGLGVDVAKPATAITPAQARKAGLPAEVVDPLCRRKGGSVKLVPDTGRDERKHFGAKA